jgi:Domain of unknown function (DUF4365)
MTAPLRKLRTRAHVLADLSINHVERQVLLCGSSVQRMQSDYGYDLVMSSFNAIGEIEEGIVFFQVKATDDLPLLADGKTISWAVSRRDLLLWLSEAYPVILVVYDGRRNRASWLHIQADFVDYRSADLFLAGETIHVHLPVTNRLNRRSVQRIIQRKNAIHAQIQGRDLSDV